jgi:hypothetical protein
VDGGGGAALGVEVLVVPLLGEEGPLELDALAPDRVAVDHLAGGVDGGLGVGVEDVALGDLGDHLAVGALDVGERVPDDDVASGAAFDLLGLLHVALERLDDAYQRISGDREAKNTAKARSTRPARRRMVVTSPSAAVSSGPGRWSAGVRARSPRPGSRWRRW